MAIFLAMAAPVFGQYAGPAVLTRGEAPAAMEMPDIDFRPYIFAGLSYDTGLAGVSVNPATGALAESSSYGVALQWGLSGSHSWRHTHLGVNYSGLLNHYAQRSYYDGINQTMMIGLTHALTRHMTLSIFESGGMFSRQYRTDALAQTVPFDPSTLYTPNTDYFDNRTYFSSTNAGLTWQESARLSMHVAGGYYMTSRRSQALTGTAARSATGDIQYRLSRRTTIGGTYTFSHYGFSRVQGGSDGHAFAGVYSVRISRSVEFSGYGGVMRVESKFIQTLAVDPAIAALLGLAADSQIGQQIYHTIDTIPYWGARVSKVVPRGVLYGGAGSAATPGNGLFLTSYETRYMGGYSYTGLRRWSLTVQGTYAHARGTGPIAGQYSTGSGGIVLSRSLTHSLHFMLDYSVRNYQSATFDHYNRVIYSARTGLTFAPGDIPLRLW